MVVFVASDLNVDLEKLEEISKVYTYSTGINSKVFDDKGDIISTASYRDQINFCDLVWDEGNDKEVCKHAYIHGGLQSAKKGDVYVYFCPYGMVKWSVAVLENDRMSHFISAGPVLVHPVDDLMVERVIEKNKNLKGYSTNIRKYLQEIDFIDSDRIYWLARMLYLSIVGVSYGEMHNSMPNNRKKPWVNSRLYQHEGENIKREQLYDNFFKNILNREQKLLDKIKLGDRKGGEKLIDWLITNFKSYDGDFELLRIKAIELIVILARQLVEMGSDIELMFEKEYLYIQQIQDCHDKEELTKCLNEALSNFLKEGEIPSEKNKNKEMISKAIEYIEGRYRKDIKLEDVAKEVGLSSGYFSRIFKQETGYSFTEYVNRVRIRLSKELLKKYDSLAEVALLVGFSDQSYFCKTFKRITGLSPGQYKNAVLKNFSRESK